MPITRETNFPITPDLLSSETRRQEGTPVMRLWVAKDLLTLLNNKGIQEDALTRTSITLRQSYGKMFNIPSNLRNAN